MWKTVVKDEVAADVSYKKVVEGITIQTPAPPEERPIGYMPCLLRALMCGSTDSYLSRREAMPQELALCCGKGPAGLELD